MCVNDKHVTLHQVVKELGAAWFELQNEKSNKKEPLTYEEDALTSGGSQKKLGLFRFYCLLQNACQNARAHARKGFAKIQLN